MDTLPAGARAALVALVAADADLAGIEAAAGPLPWRRTARGFPGLLHAITAQLISNQASAAIWGRLAALPCSLDPAAFLSLDEAALRGAGLSRPKVAHARALAEAFTSGVLDPNRLEAMDDEAAIACITAIRGLGRWSAEVYLLFAHQRADVFPAGDVALASAAGSLKGVSPRPSPVELRRMAQGWQPHRGLAARLLWHHWRHVTGRPAMDSPPPS